MERLCFTFEIRPGTEADYKKRHDEIWPELVQDIQNAGMKNYSIFRRGSQIVGYVECHPDIASSFQKLAGSEANARWSKWFEDVIIALTDAQGNLFRLDEVWHLD